jgi:hypothetical protein
MRTVTYKSVRDEVAGLLGWDRENLSTDDRVTIDGRIAIRLAYAWDVYPWPEWTPVEKRLFRKVYASASTYVATNEVFFYPTRSYYVALRAVPISQPPATKVSGEYVLNDTYWAVSAGSYSGDEYDSAHTYVRGEAAYYPDTDKFYQLHAATSTGNAPSDAAYWGELVEFERVIEFEQVLADGSNATPLGRVHAVYSANPRTQPDKAERLSFFLQDNGVRISGGASEPIVWVKFSERRPVFSGDVYDATDSYAAGERMYFTDGDYYLCLSAATAGQTPVTHAAKWALIEFPDIVSRYVIEGVAGDIQAKPEGEGEAYPNEREACHKILEMEWDNIERGQQQDEQLNVVGI